MVTPKNSFAGPAPHVGDLATLHYPADNYPYIVTAVSANGAKVTWCYLADPEGNLIELQSWAN